MNFTESFSEFSSRLGPTDLALYAGAGLVLWVLFKDKLSPVQKVVVDFMNKLKNRTPKVTPSPITATEQPHAQDEPSLFFDLVVSWKQTRDLAERSGCQKAVEVADQMFPYLSPMVCDQKVVSDEK